MEWSWGSSDAPRAARAAKVKVLSAKDGENPSLECEGSGGAHYYTTLESCSCADFSINMAKGKPVACKHMVCLAMRLGFLNSEGRTPHDQFLHDFQELEDRLAKYAWHYYVLDDALISDQEYDELKSAYMCQRLKL